MNPRGFKTKRHSGSLQIRDRVTRMLDHADADYLSKALFESRERWKDLAMLAGDIAYETNQNGEICFINPPDALGYPPNTCLGMSGTSLLPDAANSVIFNPFLPLRTEIRRRAWLRHASGETKCFSFSVRRLTDNAGGMAGARGIAQDITSQSEHDSVVAAALRRGELLEHIMWRMRQEIMAPRMMQAVLEALMNALGALGVVLVNADAPSPPDRLLHAVGTTPGNVISCITDNRLADSHTPKVVTSEEGHPILLCPTITRLGEPIILGLWKSHESRNWDGEDCSLASSVTAIIAVILEHEAIQREMARQARTDPLTGLFNRRAFFEEVDRRIGRSDRDGSSSILMYLDLDHFKWINDAWGHEAGDAALCQFSALLRSIFRPSDLVARLGGDEFSVWMEGGDQFSAAERAERLRTQVQSSFSQFANGREPNLGVSIGMACRDARSGESIDSLMRRADVALYQIKRSGRGQWLVSHDEPI